MIGCLSELFRRRGFEECCEQWRYREIKKDFYADIYDGKIWKDFSDEEKQFLSVPGNLAFMLNIDWFQPFKRRADISVGVLFLVILNLPRNQRYKRENVILLGVLPPLSKLPDSVNTFLEPVVSELQRLWQGVDFHTHNSPSRKVKRRAALLCVAADIPAARKICGFPPHMAKKGCSRCLKEFHGFGITKDYSGFNRDIWTPRHDTLHRQHADKIRNTLNVNEKEKLQKRFGVKYSELLKLPYYDSVKFCIIDPMHNLYLGTAKKIFTLWVESGILSASKLDRLNVLISEVKLPSGTARLPAKISSNYSSFKVAHWKLWTLVYYLYCFSKFPTRNQARKPLYPEVHMVIFLTRGREGLYSKILSVK